MAEYLTTINRAVWVTAFFRDCHFGYITSDIVELVILTHKLDCELSILNPLNEIWHIQMTVQYKRQLEVRNITNGQMFTNFCNGEVLTS